MNDMLIRADARSLPLPDGCVDCSVTSPPYFGLRDYGIAGQIGLEASPDEYVAQLVTVFREVRRVMKPSASLWLNLGDSYANDGKWGGHTGGKHSAALHCSPIGRSKRYTGLKPKDLIGIPWRVAFALQADGWWLRQHMPWLKRNGMPESAKDRPTTTVESIFLLSKSEQCYYDHEAVMKKGAVEAGTRAAKGGNVRSALKDVNGRPPEYWNYTGVRLRRSSDWFFESFEGLLSDERGDPLAFVVNTQSYAGAHFATMPEALVEPCILAGCPLGGVVLDPFVGSGTVGAVAERTGRRWIGVDLNAAYHVLAKTRTAQRGLLGLEIA